MGCQADSGGRRVRHRDLLVDPPVQRLLPAASDCDFSGVLSDVIMWIKTMDSM